MADRPILFSAPMIQALLAGRKTQTRRVIRGAPADHSFFCDRAGDGTFAFVPAAGAPRIPARVPFAVSDRIWVRKTFSGPHGCRRLPPRDWPPHGPRWYWADGEPGAGEWTAPKPGIHMPRSTSRLTLTVTDVRVERLQNISEVDAIAEGIDHAKEPASFGWKERDRFSSLTGEEHIWRYSAVAAYRDLWVHINGAGAWKANPWVTAVSFEVHRSNIDTMGKAAHA